MTATRAYDLGDADAAILYSFPTAGVGDRVDEIIVPVPSDDVVPIVALLLGCTAEPVPIRGLRAWWIWARTSKPTAAEFGALYDGISDLTGLGIKLVDAIGQALAFTGNLHLRRALVLSHLEINGGSPFSETLERVPGLFDRSVIGQIRAAEATDSVSPTLKGISAYIAITERLRWQVLIALLYPVGLSAMVYLIISVILYFIIPKLGEAFAVLGATLPVYTRVEIACARVVRQAPAVLLIGPALAVCLWMLRSVISGPAMRTLRKLPVVGRHYLLSQLALTISTMAGLLKNGIQLPEATDLTAEATTDAAISPLFHRVAESLRAGEPAQRAFAPIYQYFGRMTADLRAAVKIGESTGSLPGTLGKVAEKYQRDFARSNEVYGKVFEPVSTVVLGLVVGAVIFAAYYPIITAASHV